MKTLFIETSTGSTGIAITADSRVLAESLIDSPGRRQNSWLLPEIEKLLKYCSLSVSDIDLFACTKGPGSFTGIRTGIATIQGLAFATGKPAVGISSLQMLAMNLSFSKYQICPMFDARKNEVYTAIYRVEDFFEPLLHEKAVNPDDFVSGITGNTIFLGDGAVKYRELIVSKLGSFAHFVPFSHNLPRPACGAYLAESALKCGAESSPEKLLPSYLRLSEAEISRQQKI